MVTINFDKLEVSLKQTPETDCLLEFYEQGREMKKENFLLYNPRPLSDYKCVWEVFDTSKKIRLGLFFIGFKRFANADYCRFKFDDSLFYNPGFDFAGAITKLCYALRINFTGISSLDIAFDTDEACIFPGWVYHRGEITSRAKVGDYATKGLYLSQFVEAAAAGAVTREAKFNRCKIDPIAEFEGNGRGYDTLYLGGRGSSCFARIYNKTKEMTKKGVKTFVTEDWRRRGYDGVNEVWRFEISFNHLAAKRGRVMLDLPGDGFVLLSNALQWVTKDKAPSMFFAAQREFFTFTTKGGNSHRRTVFYTEQSYNCGYVIGIKKVKQPPKKTKDIIKYNTLTRYFAKYTRGIFRTPEAREYFSLHQRINANAFVVLYEDLHAKYIAAKGSGDLPENDGFYLKTPPPVTGCPMPIT